MQLDFKYFLALLGIQAKLHRMEWVAEEKEMAPDNFGIRGITINGMFPGPTVNVTMGDSVEIKVINRIGRPLTLHWHGMLQKGSPESDGVPKVTQDPIPDNGAYMYRFSVPNQAGTFWYHAHTKLDADVCFGALIIMEPKPILRRAIELDESFRYSEERVILLSDLWHKPLDQMYNGLVSVPFKGIGEPQSILTNGGTYAEWGAESNLPFNNGYSVINVKPNTRYRLRLISAQGATYYSFRIPGHNFTVIEAEGTLVKPFSASQIDLNSGMRYSVILQTHARPENHYIYTSVIGGGDKLNNGVAILHYEGAPDPTRLRKRLHIPPKNTRQLSSWFEDQLQTLITYEYPLPTSYHQSLLLSYQFKVEEGHFRFKVNDIAHQERNLTILSSVMAGTCKPEPGVYPIQSNNLGVQLVMQSLVPENSPCSAHPWHIHGHSFYVLGRGSGYYSPKVHDRLLKSNPSPIIRDTFTLFPDNISNQKYSTEPTAPPINPNSTNTRSCGWTAVRFLANNPGAWLMHCHINAHMIMGMQIIMAESPKLS